MVQVVLTTPVGAFGNWPLPDDWNPDDNTVECIGAGGGGGAGLGTRGGHGGGGGAYAIGRNVNPPNPAPYYIPGAGNNTVNGLATNFGVQSNAPQSSGANIVSASCGANGTTTAAGQGGNLRYPTGGAQGGSGGTVPGGTNYPGAGGGGAAGPNGAGSTGSGTTGNGGAGNGGLTAGGGSGNLPGGNGNSWGTNIGAGGGGGGGSNTSQSGGLGGLYGGGGGGPYGTITNASNNARQGLIVINYTPRGPTTVAIFMA